MTRAAVVVPTNRPERMQEFCTAWEGQFNQPDVRLIVVEDGPALTPGLPPWVEHHCWGSIDAQLGEKARCIGRKSGAVRSFGFWLAAQDETIDMIVSLDDDVRPNDETGPELLEWHWGELETPRLLRWFQIGDSVGVPIRPRGLPYHSPQGRPVLNHGLWIGAPDYDAYTQLKHGAEWPSPFVWHRTDLVPPGQYFSLCSMNYAFRREVAPYAFLPPPPDGMRRWNDIWSGLCFKRLADLHGWAVTSGYPCVRHERASDPVANLKEEMLGYGIHEELWKTIDRVSVGAQPLDTYRKIAVAIRDGYPQLATMASAMWEWASLWPNTTTPEAKVVRLTAEHIVHGPLVDAGMGCSCPTAGPHSPSCGRARQTTGEAI